MGLKQITIFLENKAGRLGEVTNVLAEAGINLRAISIADTADFGILRLVVNKHDEALKILNNAGFTTKISDVVALQIDDAPGSLARVMDLFRKTMVNIEYLYSSLEGGTGKAVVIIKLGDYQKGYQIIKENGIPMVESF